jgi:hypothetical protein
MNVTFKLIEPPASGSVFHSNPSNISFRKKP